MQTFKQWCNNPALIESNYARVYQHTKDRNIGIISASRGELTAAENNSRHNELKKAVRDSGYGYIRVHGSYIENHGTKDARKVSEKSLLVVGKKGNDKGALKGFLKSQGTRFNQDTILHKASGDQDTYLHHTKNSTNGKKPESINVGKWHPNRAGEFHTSMKGDKKHFTWESFVYLSPRSFFLREDKLF